jgi:hypothetical protein
MEIWEPTPAYVLITGFLKEEIKFSISSCENKRVVFLEEEIKFSISCFVYKQDFCE